MDDTAMLLFTFRDRSEFAAGNPFTKKIFAINEMPLFHNASLIYVVVKKMEGEERKRCDTRIDHIRQPAMPLDRSALSLLQDEIRLVL